MTPLGHISVSYLTGRSSGFFVLPAVIAGGVLPDVDFLFVFFSWFNTIHRVATHNVFFICLASVIAALLAQGSDRYRVGASLFAGGVCHLFIDSVMDMNPTNGLGIAVFWPVSSSFFSPFNILSTSSDIQGWNEPVAMMKRLVPSLIYELPFYVAAGILYLKNRAENVVTFPSK
jgi:membrane-bound metal-dependent hydrolase YbcI (DUF457 family)